MPLAHKLKSDLPLIMLPATARRITDQCDCACAETRAAMPTLAETPMPLNQSYRLADETRLTSLTSDWHWAFQPHSPVAPIVINTPARNLLDTFRTPRAVTTIAPTETYAVRQFLFAQLIQPLEQVAPRIAPHATTCTAWLHLTNTCNLRCPICYLPKTNETMPLETGRRAIDAIVRSALQHNYSRVKLKYAGGEPLLVLPNLLSLHTYARQKCEQHHLALDGIVLSNGTLLDAQVIEQLKSHHLRLMVSLDGVGATHDAQRPYPNGKGSFTRVAQNIERALAHGLVPDISITISNRNLAGLPETVAYVLAHNLPFALNFYRENDCAATHTDLPINEEHLIHAMQQVLQLIQTHPSQTSLLGGLLDRTSLIAPHTHTCSVGRDYMVIDTYGHFAKCQMQIARTLTDVHADDPLSIIRADATGIQNLSVDEKEDCRTCEWKYFCTGGCPLATVRTTGRYDAPSPYCRIYRTLLPEIIKLEGMRLLQNFASAHVQPSVNAL